MDGIAEVRETTHQLLGEPGFVQLVEIGLPEIPIGLAGGQQMIGDQQNLVGDGHGGALRATASVEAEKLRMEVTRSMPHRGMRRLDSHRLQVEMAVADPSLALMPRAFIVARVDH